MQANCLVLITNDVSRLSELVGKYSGRPPDAQRRCFGGGVTWFTFVTEEARDDGRLVPKETRVCHVARAASVVASRGSLRIRVPRSSARDPGDSAEPVYAALFRFREQDGRRAFNNWRCDLIGNAASTERGSPERHQQAENRQLYQVTKRVAAADATVYHVREVIGDVHLFVDGSAQDESGEFHLVLELEKSCEG